MTALCPWDRPVWGQARPIYERSLSLSLHQAELWLIDAVLRGHRRGRGQPALCCLHREIASKRPAARVKKILHSGSAQMNPGGAWNCFQWHSSQYIITWRNSVTNDICKCGFSWRFGLQADIFVSIYTCRVSLVTKTGQFFGWVTFFIRVGGK